MTLKADNISKTLKLKMKLVIAILLLSGFGSELCKENLQKKKNKQHQK